MGLIYCSECGKQISDMAQSCPNCGAPIVKQQSKNNLHPQNIEEKDSNNPLFVLGYLTSALSFFIFPIILGIAGMVLGIINITKRESTHGTLQIIIAAISLFIEFSYECE